MYQAFEPAEALRLANELGLVQTPKHGSWLKVAEPELSVPARQCLDRRIASRPEVTLEAEAWDERRNTRQVGIEWQFTTEGARIKLKHLYPKMALLHEADQAVSPLVPVCPTPLEQSQ